ncbi:MAG: hypothetical protein ACYCS1_05085 [Gammaproteobacteria bacterium]
MNKYDIYKITSAVGIALMLLVYFLVIILDNFWLNPNFPTVAQYISVNILSLPIINILMMNVPIGDYVLELGLFIAVISSLIGIYFKTKNLRLAFGKTLFNYSIFLAILIFFTIYISNGLMFLIFHITLATSGFEWWTHIVTTNLCLFPYVNYNASNPNCYFLNYAELFIFSIIGIIIGYKIYISEK